MANTGHCLARLVDDQEFWAKWRRHMPIIVNKL
jgi:hypothetical protein